MNQILSTMKSDIEQHNRNHRTDHRRHVRRRRAEITERDPNEEEQQRQNMHQQKQKQTQQQKVGCLPEFLEISFPDPSETFDLSAGDHDYCAGETIFRFQHFRYGGPHRSSSNHMGSTPETEAIESKSSSSSVLPPSTMPEAFPLHWYINCCDSPQLNTNGNTDFFMGSDINGQYRPTNIMRDLQPNSTNIFASQTQTVDRSQKYQNAYFCQMFVSAVASFLSLVIILSIALPLLRKRKRTRASTYNLYLVFLAIPDLVYNVFLFYLYATYDEWTTEWEYKDRLPLPEHPFDLALFGCCASASLYLNAVIASELLRLLRNSKLRKRSKAPTLKRATFKSLCVYAMGTIVFLIDHFCADFLNEILPLWGVWLITIPLTVGFPILYLVWVCFRIWWEQLFGDSNSKAGKRLRVLVKFFLRIIVIYIGLWVPMVSLYLFRYDHGMRHTEGVFYYAASILYAIQAWIGFAMSLTKPDVLKMVIGLFTCKHCRNLTEPEPAKKSVFSTKVSTDNQNSSIPPEKQAPTQSTGDDSESSYVIDVDLEGNPDPYAAVSSTFHGSSDTLSIDDNIFDFDGKDAPVERPVRQVKQRRASIAMGIRRMIRRPSMSFRTSTIFNANKQENEQQIPQHSMAVRGSKGSTNKFLDGSVSRMGSISEPLFPDAEFAEAMASMAQSKRLSITGIMPQVNMSDSDESGSCKSFSGDTTSSSQSATMQFLMDSNASNKDLIRSYMESPKERRRWMKVLRKNVRDLRRQLKRQKLTEVEKSIYRQSMWHQQKALEVAASVDSLGRFSAISGISGITTGDRSSGASSFGNKRDSRITSYENMGSLPSSSRRSSLSSTIRSVSSSEEDGEDYSEDFHMLHGKGHKFKVERETSYSKNHWADDLRHNIEDLSSRLESEKISQRERVVVTRAIKSQRMTLHSIDGMDDMTRSMLFGQSPFSSPVNSPKVSPKRSPTRPKRSTSKILQRKSSAYMQSSLEVIDDDSDEMQREEEKEIVGSKRQRSSKTDISMFRDETGRTDQSSKTDISMFREETGRTDRSRISALTDETGRTDRSRLSMFNDETGHTERSKISRFSDETGRTDRSKMSEFHDETGHTERKV